MRYNLTTILNLVGEKVKVLNANLDNGFRFAKRTLDADEESITFISDDRSDAFDLLNLTKAAYVFVGSAYSDLAQSVTSKVVLLCDKPKEVFAEVVSKLFLQTVSSSIHPTAIINKLAKIGKNVSVGPYSVIENCVIQDNVEIGAHCFLNDYTFIDRGAKLASGVKIGQNGFGFLRNEDGSLFNFPHLGGVFIGENVEIGANTCIDRGALSDTQIGEGTKVDNLVHIAHNVKIGKHCMIVANSMIGGSTVIGDYAYVAPSAAIKDGLTIGETAMCGIGSVVLKNVPNNQIWIGVPAKYYKENNL